MEPPPSNPALTVQFLSAFDFTARSANDLGGHNLKDYGRHLSQQIFLAPASPHKHSKIKRFRAIQDFLSSPLIHNCPRDAQHASHTREQYKELTSLFLEAATGKILKHTISVPLHRLVDAFANLERLTSDLWREGRNNTARSSIIQVLDAEVVLNDGTQFLPLRRRFRDCFRPAAHLLESSRQSFHIEII